MSDLLFIQTYLSNGCNGTKAYQKIRPHVTYQTARKAASILVAKPHIQAELARQIQVEEGWTKTCAVARVLDIAQRAQDAGKLDTELHAVTELNELAGHHVKKVADVTEEVRRLTPEQRRQRLTELSSQFPALLTHEHPPASQN